MARGKVKRAFGGGNTAEGFCSFFENILDLMEAKRIILLKGGPGVGKSTFIKKIGEEAANRGFDLLYLHCSSDSDSLDGVVIPAIKTAVIDGTAPHVIDPRAPGAVDEIINLGDFWDEEKLKAHREEILSLNEEKKRLFSSAYRYIRAAFSVYGDTTDIIGRAMDRQKAAAVSARIVDDLFKGSPFSKDAGRETRLFASAITSQGLKNHLPTLFDDQKVYMLKGKQGTGTEKVLERVKQAALERGYDVEAYYCGLNPHKLEHLAIPALETAVTTGNSYHGFSGDAYFCEDLDRFLDQELLKSYKDDLDHNEAAFESLLNRAVELMGRAREIHSTIEGYYVPSIDFEAVNRCREAALAKILEA